MKNGIYSVKELNEFVKSLIENNTTLNYVKLEGELDDVKLYSSGHLYFNVIDKESSLSGVMFANSCAKLRFKPKRGDKVIITGSIKVYVKSGRYQIVAYDISLDGEGERLLKLAKLKKQLESEGLFDISHKRPINIYPHAIGLITAKGSAAEADLVTNIHRRFPLTKIYTFYSLVQGDEAPKSLVAALTKSYQYKLDTLIIGRGGGSNDDLFAFNDETLVRLAYKSPFPIISAVGHEIDFTLLDFVADDRASTPTGAAELATADKNEIYQNLDNASEYMREQIINRMQRIRDKLNSLKTRPFFLNPSSIYKDNLNDLNSLKIKLVSAIKFLLSRKTSDLKAYKDRLLAINPERVLKRGFALLRGKNGKVINKVKEIKIGETIETVMSDGKLYASVTSKEEN